MKYKKSYLIWGIVIISLIIVGFFILENTVFSKNLDLTIVHTNDTHGRIVYNEGNKIIGFSKTSTYVNQLISQKKNVLFMDAGDTLHGQSIVNISEGKSAVQLMDIMGYNYFTPGNHDFNYGYKKLIDLEKEMNFTLLSANVLNTDGSSLFKNNDIIKIKNIKIGIFGLATPETAVKTNPKNVEGLTFKDPVECANEQVKELKKKGADLIIALVHLGIDDESAGHRSYDVRDKTPGIDLIIDGHSHSTLDQISQVTGKAVITSTGAYGNNLGVVDISIKDGKKTITPKNVSFDELKDVSLNPKIEEAISKINEELSSILNDVVGKSLETLIGKTEVELYGKKISVRNSETNLTRITTDSILKETNADVVLINGGSFRDTLKQGDITRGDILNVFPFGDYIITKSVSGKTILDALEFGLGDLPSPAGRLPQVAGMTLTVDTSKPAGSRVSNLMIAGIPIDLEKNYILATNDFIAAGGDGYTMIKDTKEVNQFAGLDEILTSFIKSISPITEQTSSNVRMTIK